MNTLDFEERYLVISARDRRFDGRFYTAVTSTGIYCRPICPARTPARKNVRFYDHAASAEAAGFRPCRRCRPELSPGAPGWDLRADLVGRALRLIDDGVADDGGVAELARRLHVSERHLHRLFAAELGTGPLAVARTRRLLLAKQLLTETSLPMADVAFAAGFGSVRQFNAAMKESYRFAPGDLRRSDGPMAPGGLTLRLGVRQPFEARALLAFLNARAVPGVEEVVDNAVYKRRIPGGEVTLTPVTDHVRLTVTGGDTRQLARIVARCRRLLDLDADPHAIAAALEPTTLGPLVAARPGLRVPGAWDSFELLVRAVVGQQISVAGARTILGRIAARSAEIFPSAEEMAGLDLDGLGMTTRRVATLRAAAKAVASGEIDLEAGDPAETVAALVELPGIGPWTAGYVALRALRDPDAWPEDDLGLRRTMAALAIPMSETERWRPWRAYAALHLWNAEEKS